MQLLGNLDTQFNHHSMNMGKGYGPAEIYAVEQIFLHGASAVAGSEDA
jgi:hypothetical protein